MKHVDLVEGAILKETVTALQLDEWRNDMNADELKSLLEQVKNGNTDIDAAIDKLKDLPFSDLGHTRIDNPP